MTPGELGHLARELMPTLVLYARQWCRGPEDVVQEAFLRLGRLASQGNQVAEPKAWLYRAVRNAAISAGRAERRRQRHESQGARERSSWFVPPGKGTLDAALDGAIVTAALDDLPEEAREALILHLWGGFSFSEIAPLMSSSRSTVHRQYLQGLQLLRERLGISCPPTT